MILFMAFELQALTSIQHNETPVGSSEHTQHEEKHHQSGTKPNLVAKILATNFGVFL